MSYSLAFRSFVLGGLVTACSQSPAEPGPAASVSDAGGDSSGGSAGSGAAFSAAGLAGSGVGGAEGGASSGGSAGGTGGTLPISVNWKPLADAADANVSINVPSVASRGKDAAVAYVERTTGRVMMQRFDATGERIDSPVQLASDAVERSNVTLASDGKQYAACWNVAAEVHCSRVDEQGTVHLNALAVSGQYATIVASAAGWVLAYSGSDKHVRLQSLTPTLDLTGKFVATQRFAQFSVQDIGPLLAATPSGFALVAADQEAGDVDLVRLGADLQSVVSTAALGHNLWYAGQLVATDTRAAVSVSIAYGSFLQLLNEKELTAELPIAGGGKTGTDQALVLTEGGIGAAWLDRSAAWMDGSAAVHRRFFADNHDSDVGLEPRTPENNVLGMQEQGTESFQQLVQVGSQSVLVAKASRYGSLGALRAAALNFNE